MRARPHNCAEPQCWSRVRIPRDTGHSRPISGDSCCCVVTLVTIIESYSYTTVTSNSLVTPAPRRAALGTAKCDLASILPKVPQTPMNTGWKPVDMKVFGQEFARLPPRMSQYLLSPSMILYQ